MKTATRPESVVTGSYSTAGYEVFLNGQPVYAAGNNPHDSTALAEPGRALPVARIVAFCERTAREIAAELDAVFGGVEQAEDAAAGGQEGRPAP